MQKQYLISFICLLASLSLMSQEYYFIEKAPFNSSSDHDFSPIYVENGLVFVSDRSVSSFAGAKTAEMNNTFNLFYYDTLTKQTRQFSSKISTPGHEGPASYCAATGEFFFTRSQEIPSLFRNKDKPSTLGIFISNKQGNGWSQPEPFRYNSEICNVVHPTISEQGDILFFASDMEGSLGRMDIFYSRRTDTGWSKPVNLGLGVNTPRNEIYPYYNSSSRKLYFSSDGHPERVGKLDIYFCMFDGEKCSKAIMMPRSINTRHDDFAYMSLDDRSGYFTSRRENEMDHIYQFSMLVDKSIFSDCRDVDDWQYCVKVQEELGADEEGLYDYVWDMGDGRTANGREVTHCYEKIGTYQIALHVIDKLTNEEQHNVARYSINVEPDEKLLIQVPDVINKGNPVKISAEGTDVKGHTILSYFWMIEEEVVAKKQAFFYTFEDDKTYVLRLSIKTYDPESRKEHYFCGTKKVLVKP